MVLSILSASGFSPTPPWLRSLSGHLPPLNCSRLHGLFGSSPIAKMSRAILIASFSCSVFVINSVLFDQWPNQSPEPMRGIAVSSAIAVGCHLVAHGSAFFVRHRHAQSVFINFRSLWLCICEAADMAGCTDRGCDYYFCHRFDIAVMCVHMTHSQPEVFYGSDF